MAKVKKEAPLTIVLKNTKTKLTKQLDMAHATAFLKQLEAMKMGSLYELPSGWIFNGNDIVKV